ncbi:thioesterase domain-containing protein [Streptomyces sp. NPDC096323]|uniref:thioesterase II family protein n=1 Tax=Streptomyces sp. NPDC096323 TaxID=3155822 RepID=UPI00331D25DE
MTDVQNWLRTWSVAGTGEEARRAVLLCFPPTGLGASTFRPWQEHLGSRALVAGVQLPAREERIEEEPPRTVEEVAEAAVEALDALVPARGLALTLVGVGSGAAPALEAAALLRDRGGAVRRLVVATARPPHFVGSPGDETIDQATGILNQTDEEIVASGCSCLPGLEVAAELDSWLVERMLVSFRGTVRMIAGYRWTHEPLTCPVEAWHGADDRLVRTEHNEGWRQYAAGGFSARSFPGCHDYFTVSRNAMPPALAALLDVDEAAATHVD